MERITLGHRPHAWCRGPRRTWNRRYGCGTQPLKLDGIHEPHAVVLCMQQQASAQADVMVQ